MSDMEKQIEVTGKDIEAAIEVGLERLNVDRDSVEIDVLDEGSQGVFGLGTREARVRLKVGRRSSSAASNEPVEQPAAEPTAVEIDENEKARIAQETLQELLDLMDMQENWVEVRRAVAEEDEERTPLVLNVCGEGTDALIGYNGKTLAGLQRITRLIVGRELAGRVWLVVDAGGFRARREKSLRSLAGRMAEQAERTEQTVKLKPMPANERRIIHVELRDHPTVRTQSIGEGDQRQVTIIPQN